MKLKKLISLLKDRFPKSAEDFFSFDSLIRELLFCLEIDQSLIADTEYEIDDTTAQLLDAWFDRAISGEPLAYITGRTAFFKEEYFVGKGVLIPRCDSEVLVEKAVALLPQNAFFADFCTGSGCIAISILKSRPDLSALAIDVSDTALSYARKNAHLNEVEDRLSLKKLDIMDEQIQLPIFDAILSNPPYISSNEMNALPKNVTHEPSLALFGGIDGLDFYRKFISSSSRFLNKNGFFLFEMGSSQGNAIKSLSESHGFSCEIIKDLSGLDRCAYIKK